MKTKLSVFLLGLLFLLSHQIRSSAQEEDKFAIPFQALKSVPATVLLQTLPRHKTLNCGISRIGIRNRKVLLHLYSRYRGKAQFCYLDLFIRYKHKFHRINRFKLPGAVDSDFPKDWPPATIGKEGADCGPPIVWLDTKHQRMPIIPITTSGYSDPNNCSLLIFNRGINQKPTLQKFQVAPGARECQLVFLDQTDSRGYIMVEENINRIGSPEERYDSSTLYHWNGRSFK